MRGHTTDPWKLVQKTEVIDDNLNPDFETSILLDYQFEMHQYLKFSCMEEDGTQQEHIGDHLTELACLIGAKQQTYEGKLSTPKIPNRGTLIVRTDVVSGDNNEYSFSVRVENLPSKKKLFCLGSNSPFLVIRRAFSVSDNGQFVKVMTTDNQPGNQSPHFDFHKLKSQSLCNGDPIMPMRLEIWNHVGNGDHTLWAFVKTSLDSLERGDLVHKMLDETEKMIEGCTLNVANFLKKQRPSMGEFLRSGWKISLNVAIDFTASNGDPTEPKSLHYINSYDQSQLNDYQKAIIAIGSILENYDHDKKFPVYGYGGIPYYSQDRKVSHCFSLTGSADAEVVGTQGILEAYTSTISYGTKLYGPTLFHIFLQTMIGQIEAYHQPSEYHVILILTDGVIHDMEDTK